MWRKKRSKNRVTDLSSYSSHWDNIKAFMTYMFGRFEFIVYECTTHKRVCFFRIFSVANWKVVNLTSMLKIFIKKAKKILADFGIYKRIMFVSRRKYFRFLFICFCRLTYKENNTLVITACANHERTISIVNKFCLVISKKKIFCDDLHLRELTTKTTHFALSWIRNKNEYPRNNTNIKQ